MRFDCPRWLLRMASADGGRVTPLGHIRQQDAQPCDSDKSDFIGERKRSIEALTTLWETPKQKILRNQV